MKMQDDVQQKQIVLDLNARGKVSDEYVWKMMGLDADKIKKALKEEAIAKVENDFETNEANETIIIDNQYKKAIDIIINN